MQGPAWMTVAGRFREIAVRFSDRRTQTFDDRKDTSATTSNQRDDYRTLVGAGASTNSEFKQTP